MSKSYVRVVRLSLLCLSLMLGALSGCADMMTYSQDAQREGLKLYQRGQYAEAAGAFRNSTRQNPRNYQGYYMLGSSYEQLGQYQLAIASYKTARQTVNTTLEGKYDEEYREKILTGMASAIARSDQYNIELDAAQREAETQQSAEAWYMVAKIHEYRGDADSAIDAYNRGALLAPNSFLIAKNYGLYLEKVGQPQRAETPLRRAYSINSTDTQVADALRRTGVVPGPGILTQEQLAKPLVPRGPIPEVNMQKVMQGNSGNSGGTPGATVQAPRD